MKIIEKAKYIKSGGIVFIDMEGTAHGVYHPDEYLEIGEELARKYAATYGWQIPEDFYRLPNVLSEITQ
jgi:hypothetical protein